MKGGCFFMSYNIELLLVIRQQQITFAVFAIANGIGMSGSRLRKPSLVGGLFFLMQCTKSTTITITFYIPVQNYNTPNVVNYIYMKAADKSFTSV